MQTVLIVIHLMIVLALVGIVLIQRSEGGALASAAVPASCRRAARPMR
jgi:protein translocase SecG subunit